MKSYKIVWVVPTESFVGELKLINRPGAANPVLTHGEYWITIDPNHINYYDSSRLPSYYSLLARFPSGEPILTQRYLEGAKQELAVVRTTGSNDLVFRMTARKGEVEEKKTSPISVEPLATRPSVR